MKLEKRTAPSEPAVTAPEPAKKEKRPILIYILILFIAAFLLMTLSFLASRRSSEEVLGQLNSSVSALDRLQTALEENVRLQKDVAAQKDRINELEDQLDAALSAHEADAAQQQAQLDAMTNLYLLECAFRRDEFERCREMIQKMDAAGQTALLEIPVSAEGTPSAGLVINGEYTAPAERFEYIRRTVDDRLGS